MYDSGPLFEESRVFGDNPLDKDWRDSSTAFLDEPSEDPETAPHRIIHCIEERASRFQGHVPIHNLEALQVVKYSPSLIKLKAK
jgi:hypothetical protein